MIELEKDQLVFRFPDVHEDAVLHVEFQRTLRIPDNDRTYPLPPGFGPFPLRHVDDFGRRVPARWIEHGGVMLPMYQSEALWVRFRGDYPFAVRISTGKIDAVTGEQLRPGLGRRPQNYLVVPAPQHWLDGYCVEKGVIRQFVAMPLGAGYSAEEQVTGDAAHGGLQIIVQPMTAAKYEELQNERMSFTGEGAIAGSADMLMCMGMPMEMGLAPGGRMRQEIYDDPYDLPDWAAPSSRCFVHLANSEVWREITGQQPPTTPPTARDYIKAGLPWFELYSDATAVPGSGILNKLKSVVQLGKEKGAKNQVREGSF